MSLSAILKLGDNTTKQYDKTYNVVSCQYKCSCGYNYRLPDTDVKNNSIEITLVSPAKEDLSLYDWYIKRMLLSGCLEFVFPARREVIKTVTFENASCFEDDLNALKMKVDAGATYLVTQLFYDNKYYYRLVKEARRKGITVPILAGIMPVTNSKQLLHTAKMCGSSIPYELRSMIETYYNHPEAMKEIGINYAIHQIIDLISNGVDGIHIYTMNKPEIAQAIFDRIPTVLKELNNK